MAISFTPKLNIKEIEVEGYGKVKIRPYGAGEELQISKSFRELDELQTRAKMWLDDMKNKYGDDDDKIPVEAKQEFAEIQKEVERLSDELNDLIRGTISSDEEGVAERIYKELPLTEVRRMIRFAEGGGKDAEV